ncbi:MAG: addiction module toxin RelE [Cyclobacterium sp.]|nr:addiction module toxin RelE [Cyclobacterium sp.]
MTLLLLPVKLIEKVVYRHIEKGLSAITRNSVWQKPSDVVQDFPDADPVKNNRVVFNIAGNKYRLIVQISYLRQWVFIKFIGTHSEYDKVDASKVDQF